MAKSEGLLTVKAETKDFSKFVQKFVNRTNLKIEDAIRTVAINLLMRIEKKNPVLTGRSRAGWYVSMKGLKGPWMEEGNNSGAIAEGKKKGKFVNHLKARKDKYVMLINGVFYTIYLEYGHSKQAPAGMVRVSMREMRENLPKAIMKMYKQEWIKGKLVLGRNK